MLLRSGWIRFQKACEACSGLATALDFETCCDFILDLNWIGFQVVPLHFTRSLGANSLVMLAPVSGAKLVQISFFIGSGFRFKLGTRFGRL